MPAKLGVESVAGVEGVEDVVHVGVEARERTREASDVGAVTRGVAFRGVSIDADSHRRGWYHRAIPNSEPGEESG